MTFVIETNLLFLQVAIAPLLLSKTNVSHAFASTTESLGVLVGAGETVRLIDTPSTVPSLPFLPVGAIDMELMGRLTPGDFVATAEIAVPIVFCGTLAGFQSAPMANALTCAVQTNIPFSHVADLSVLALLFAENVGIGVSVDFSFALRKYNDNTEEH